MQCSISHAIAFNFIAILATLFVLVRLSLNKMNPLVFLNVFLPCENLLAKILTRHIYLKTYYDTTTYFGHCFVGLDEMSNSFLPLTNMR